MDESKMITLRVGVKIANLRKAVEVARDVRQITDAKINFHPETLKALDLLVARQKATLRREAVAQVNEQIERQFRLRDL